MGKKLLYLDHYIKEKLDREGYKYFVKYPKGHKWGIFTITERPQPLQQVYNYMR